MLQITQEQALQMSSTATKIMVSWGYVDYDGTSRTADYEVSYEEMVEQLNEQQQWEAEQTLPDQIIITFVDGLKHAVLYDILLQDSLELKLEKQTIVTYTNPERGYETFREKAVVSVLREDERGMVWGEILLTSNSTDPMEVVCMDEGLWEVII